jgi:peptidoglycan/xylan/chitin deacetylase (PgdA/CDA1 family)
MLSIVKRWNNLDLDRFLDNVANAVGVNMTPEQERAYADRMVMTWDQVRALRDAGMDVQSHTATHRVLQTLCERELWQELVRSRHVLQDVVGAPVNAVSYPVGRQLDLPTERIVAACGYELGFSNATGFNTRWTLRPYNVKRVAMDRGVSLEFFRAMLTAPILAY